VYLELFIQFIIVTSGATWVSFKELIEVRSTNQRPYNASVRPHVMYLDSAVICPRKLFSIRINKCYFQLLLKVGLVLTDGFIRT